MSLLVRIALCVVFLAGPWLAGWAACRAVYRTAFVDNATEVPPIVEAALLASEDHAFLSRRPQPARDLLAAAVSDVNGWLGRRGYHCGGTIPAALVRTYIEPERRRHFHSTLLVTAIGIEATMSKQEILAAFAARAYFGSGQRGIEAAAAYYFDKRAADLTHTEAAVLAGALQGPSRFLGVERSAQARTRYVLDQMARMGSIGDTELAVARASVDTAVARVVERYRDPTRQQAAALPARYDVSAATTREAARRPDATASTVP